MAKQTIHSKILDQALSALKKETSLSFSPVNKNIPEHADAYIALTKTSEPITVEVKKSIQKATIGAALHQLKSLPQPSMLVTDYINPSIAKLLKDENVQFLDCAGNAYLNLPPIYIYISGQKPLKEINFAKAETSRAFDVAGLKVIYGLLCNEALINASYREIAEQAGVANGSVGWVINSLKSAGYIIDTGENRQLIHRRKLLDRWVESYPEKLKPKLHLGDFVSDDPTWWKSFDIAKFGAYWGGEVGAEKYTAYLKPQVATVYLPEASGNKILAVAKLKKAADANGDAPGFVRIYRPFWTEKLQNKSTRLVQDAVHPILIYADLISTADSRNLETARKLYDSSIAKYIGEN